MYDANKMQFTSMKSENDTTCENFLFSKFINRGCYYAMHAIHAIHAIIKILRCM